MSRPPQRLDRIKAVIIRCGPQTVKELSSATGMHKDSIRSTLTQAMNHKCGIIHAGKKGNFFLYGMPGVSKPPAKDLPRGYVPEFRELKRDFFEHMKLAVMGR